MAEAMRRVSIRQGYDPAEHALVAFGGAGGQHACAIAELLEIPAAILPVDAGLLSARGLGAARLERFAQQQVLRPLSGRGEELSRALAELAASAAGQLAADGLPAGEIEIRRRLVFLRFLGQESALEIELGHDLVDEEALAAAFRSRFEQVYGYLPQRQLEVVALRVVASERQDFDGAGLRARPAQGGHRGPPLHESLPVEPFAFQEAFFGGAFRPVPCYEFEAPAGATIVGPALIFDASASLVVEAGWRAIRSPCGAWVARRG
jgi:5-oxoprolinase (ATP-hydrolysing)